MIRYLRYLHAGPTTVVVALLLAGSLACVWGVVRAHARLEVDALQRALCAEKTRAILSRNAFLRRGVVDHGDACRTLRALSGDQP